MGFEVFQRQAQVEDGLRAGADHHDRGACQLLEVRGDVHRGLRAAVHAADAAGGEDLNAGHVGDHHRGRDGGGPVQALGHKHGQIPAGGLGHGLPGLAQVFDLLRGQTGLEPPAQNGDRRGDGAAVADDLLHVQRGLYVLRIGHPVGNDRGFQRDDGLSRRHRRFYFGIYVQIRVVVHYINLLF